MFKRLLVCIGALVILASCNTLPAAIPAPTLTLTSTLTFTPTLTPTATITPSPTPTPTPSLTPTPTQIPITEYELLRIIEDQTMDAIRHITFSPDSKMLISGSQDPDIRVWNVSNGHLVTQFGNKTGINWSLAISPNGRYIASSFWNYPEIQIWDLSKNGIGKRIKTNERFNRSLDFSPDGKILLSFSDQFIEMWSVTDGTFLNRFAEADNYIREGEFSPDGKLIAASTSLGNDVFIWSVDDGNLLHRIDQSSSDYNSNNVQISFTHDGHMLGLADRNRVKLYDLQTGEIISTYKLSTGETLAELFFSPDDRYLFGLAEILGYFDRTTLYVWDVQENTLVRSLKRRDFDDSSGKGFSLAAMSPNGKYLVIGIGRTKYFIFGVPESLPTSTQNTTATPPPSLFYWDFETEGNSEGWDTWNQLDPFQVTNGELFIKSISSDPYVFSPAISAEAAVFSRIIIRMRVSAGEFSQIYFTTYSESLYDESKSLSFPIISDGQYHTYTLNMLENYKWNGVITRIRLDPTTTSATIGIDYVQLTKPEE